MNLDALFSPPAVTLVGASPNSHASTALIRNFTRPDCTFRGPLHLVNPNRPDVKGHPAVASLDDIEGELGLVYLLVGTERSHKVLAEIAAKDLSGRITAVVAYAAGFAEAGDEAGQAQLVAEAEALGVPLLGPQSTGVISASAGLLGITDPVPERFVPGRVGFVAQSTGLLGGAVSWLLRRGLGVGAGVGFGNGAALGFHDLAPVLLRRDDIDVVCVYADALSDVEQIAELGRAARQIGKPVVLYRGAQTPSARRLAMSHTGMLATGARVIRGVAEQHGVLIAETFEELLWGAELFVREDIRKLKDARVGVITGSGGGGLIAAESIERAGLTLAEPTPETLRALEVEPGKQANPLDVGAISLDTPETYQRLVSAFVSDPNYGIVVKIGSLGAPSEAMPTHHRMSGVFCMTARMAGKLPIIAFSLPEDPRDYRETVPWEGVLVTGGDAELVGKLRLLQAWTGTTNTGLSEQDAVEPEAPADDEIALDLARSLGLRIPATVVVEQEKDVWKALSALEFPVVAKTAKPMPHRAKAGGVVVGVRDEAELRATAEFLRLRFGAAVTVTEQVEHDDAYFVGLQRDAAGRLLLAFGHGVATDDSDVMLRLCPIDLATATAMVARADRAPDGLAELLVRASELIASRPDVAVVDMNPLVVARDGALVALDVKVYQAQIR